MKVNTEKTDERSVALDMRLSDGSAYVATDHRSPDLATGEPVGRLE